MPSKKSAAHSKKSSKAKSASKSAPKAPPKSAAKKATPPKAPLPKSIEAKSDVLSPSGSRAKLLDSADAPAPKPVIAKKGGRRPDLDTLKGMPTEELWVFYRRANQQRPKDEAWIEVLRNVLMELHYPLVKHIAERLLQTLPKSIELDDLVSAGLFGLMDAIRGFDPDRGIKFKTYCTTRIRGSILDQLRSQDWVPRLVRLKASRIEKALQRLQGEYGREPTHAELAAALEMQHGELAVEISSSHAKTMFSLSEHFGGSDEDGTAEKVEVLEDKSAVDPIGELNRRDVMNFITRALTYKERFIIEQYYQVGHTMREIGEMLALTESRVCQIHSNVMSRLQSLLNQKSEGFHT